MSGRQASEHETRWTPFLYLFYTGFVFLQPIFDHAGWKEWCLTLAGVLVFVILYLTAWWRRGALGLWCIIGIAALGFIYFPYNGGASAFVIYAAAFFAFAFQPAMAFVCLGALLAGIGLESWILHLILWAWAPAMMLTAAIGAANIHAATQKRANTKLRLAHEEVEHLAKVAERERIARDLHDVLGHTLSVVILKSELASKLLDRDVERARTEIAEVEQIARDALAEVRHAIRGYRAGSLAEEFARARSTLETAGVRVEAEVMEQRSGSTRLSAAQETVLALVVREAVTNIVRHSRAQNCRICFEQITGHYRVEIADDGRGGSKHEGNGLRGMRERVEALNGTMVRDSSQGTRLTVTIPVAAKQEAIA